MDIKKVAKLSRLNLCDEELKALEEDFELILNYFGQIAEVETNEVEPLRTPVEINLSLRPDLAEDWENKTQALEGAPEAQFNQYKVPPVV